MRVRVPYDSEGKRLRFHGVPDAVNEPAASRRRPAPGVERMGELCLYRSVRVKPDTLAFSMRTVVRPPHQRRRPNSRLKLAARGRPGAGTWLRSRAAA
jgi:hypothetical protein